MPSIAQGFSQTTPNMLWWVLGQRTEVTTTDERRDGLNAFPQAVEITTATISNPGDNSIVGLTIDGVAISVSTGVGAISATAVAALLVTAINADPIVFGRVTASNAAAVLSLTGREPGVPFVVTGATAGVAAVTETQAAALAQVVEFARAVCHTGYQNTDRLVAKAQSALFTTLQVFTGSLTFVTGAIVRGVLFDVVGGERREIARSAPITSSVDVATTTAALIAAMNATAPTPSVNFTGTTTVIGTSERAGFEYALELIYESGGAGSPVFTITNTVGPNVATSFHRAFKGVSERDQAVGAITVGGVEMQYPANSCLTYCKRGTVAVESSQVIASGDPVFVELAAGVDAGKFFNTTSSTRIRLSLAQAAWELDANADTGNLAALRVTL